MALLRHMTWPLREEHGMLPRSMSSLCLQAGTHASQEDFFTSPNLQANASASATPPPLRHHFWSQALTQTQWRS